MSTFVIPFYHDSETVINYGSGSGSAKVRNYIRVPVPQRQKVTVPTVPVPQQCLTVRVSTFGEVHMCFENSNW